MKRLDDIKNQCLNCGKDTGCPNKLVCDDCRKGNPKKELFFKKYIETPDNPLLKIAGFAEIGPMTSKEIDKEVYK